jgi:hypothetical protein
MSGNLIDQQASGAPTDSLNPNFGESLPGFENLTIVHALTDDLKEQLVARSSDETDAAIQQNTSDCKRFGNLEKLDDWLAKGRDVNVLVGPDGELAGIFWSGDERMPGFDDADHQQLTTESVRQVTIAFRLYPPHRGNQDRLATTFFTDSVTKLLGNTYEDIVVWAETNDSNVRMKTVNSGAGMEQLGINPSNGRVLFAIANFKTEVELSEVDDVVGQAEEAFI